MRFWGLRIGTGCRFLGVPILRRYPYSTISIGRQCTFISSSRYNFIGINHPCAISTHNTTASLVIGEQCGFSGTAIGCALDIRIGNRVRCGANTIITDTDWHTDDLRTSPNAPVVIEDDVWLGVNVTVLKGVRIGGGSVIGAGSVVATDIPAGVVAAGTPARVLRTLPDIGERKVSRI
jgi:acetyltransferase-like isoleucine patch superfamily enzyme